MRTSPLGSKLLSLYAIVFAGLAPAVLASFALVRGLGIFLVGNIVFGGVIVFYGIRVFLGDARAVKVFGVLVMLHYFGVTLTNVLNYGDFPVDSRAHEMAVPRMIRGVLFGAFYAWYYLLRKKTRDGFES